MPPAGGNAIRVNAIAPKPIWTTLQVSGGQTRGNLKKFGEDSPLGRPRQPAELALAFVPLAADESSYDRAGVWRGGGADNPWKEACPAARDQGSWRGVFTLAVLAISAGAAGVRTARNVCRASAYRS